MIFLNRVHRGRYLLVKSAEGVLGRDVLNHLVLIFMVRASNGRSRVGGCQFDATSKDDLELIRQRVAEREKTWPRTNADV